MADLLITRVGPGVAIARSTDPFSSFRVHRLDRERWLDTPGEPGVYVLYGALDGEQRAYIGMSTTDIRARIGSHRANEKMAWFGVLFAIPLPTTYVQSVEAELIRLARDADVVRLANTSQELRWLDGDDVHLSPAVDVIMNALELLLGADIFTARDEPESAAPAAGNGTVRTWTMEEWLAEARRHGGDDYALGVEQMVRDWTGHGPFMRAPIGSGKKTTAIFLTFDVGDTSYWPFALYPGGIEVPFQWMAVRPATEPLAVRMELLTRLNAIDGIHLDETKIDRRPSFPVDVVANPQTRAQLLEVGFWLVDQAQANVGANR